MLKRTESCGVIAVYRPQGAAAALVRRGLCALQHRGQEAAGIATADAAGTLHSLRGRGMVLAALPHDKVAELPGTHAVGHVRYSTVATDRSEDIQPVLTDTPYGWLALAHNGNFHNAEPLTRELEQTGPPLSTSMDTEILAQLVARTAMPSFAAALRHAAMRVAGAFSLAMLCGGRLFGLRDPHGVRPLVVGQLDGGGWIIASETCALDAVGAAYLRQVRPGELVEVGADGPRSVQLLEPAAPPAPCVFELVYFARPDSLVFGHNVRRTRMRMGEELAFQDDARGDGKPDVVVPVPDSGLPAALGYAQRRGVPLVEAILRNQSAGRTFILPDQDSRLAELRHKLSVCPEAVDGKRVALIDDSIVRGNTARLLVQQVRAAGARTVHLRIASPPLAWPCYLGIDTPNDKELIFKQQGGAARVAELIGADDLRYLDLDGLRRATGGQPFCMACMNGVYPV